MSTYPTLQPVHLHAPPKPVALIQLHANEFMTVFHPSFYRVASFNRPYDQPGSKDTWDPLTHESLTPLTRCYPSERTPSLPNHIGSGSRNANARGRG